MNSTARSPGSNLLFVKRHDRAGLAAPKSATIFEGRAARTHDRSSPLKYADRDEYRDAAELRKLCARMAGVPVTLGHGGKKVGSVTDARIDGDHLVVTMAITDAVGERAIKSGAAPELSLGYNCDADAAGYQRGIDPFELSLVEKARCGPTCSTRADCACGTKKEDAMPRLTSVVNGHQHLIDTNPSPGSWDANNTSHAVSSGEEYGHSHPWIRNPDGTITIGEVAGHVHTILDEKAYAAPRGDSQIDRPAAQPHARLMFQTGIESIDKSLADAKDDAERAGILVGVVKQEKQRADEAERLLADGAAKAESEALKKERERADAADGKVRELEAAFKSSVRSRSQLEREAVIVLGTGFRLDDLTDRQVRDAVCKRLDASLDTKTIGDAEMVGHYSQLIRRHAANAESQARVGEILGRNTHSARADEQNERAKREDARRNQWKQTLADGEAQKKGA